MFCKSSGTHVSHIGFAESLLSQTSTKAYMSMLLLSFLQNTGYTETLKTVCAVLIPWKPQSHVLPNISTEIFKGLRESGMAETWQSQPIVLFGFTSLSLYYSIYLYFYWRILILLYSHILIYTSIHAYVHADNLADIIHKVDPSLSLPFVLLYSFLFFTVLL